MTDEQKGEISENLAKQILDALMKEDFWVWYENQFVNFISGDMEHKKGISYSTAEILIKQDIKRLFNLNA